MKKKIVALCVFSISTQAFAGFSVLPASAAEEFEQQSTVVNTPRAPVFPGARNQLPVTANARTDMSSEQLVGKRKIPLNEALKNIMPVGYQGHADKSMDWSYLVEAQQSGDFQSDLRALSSRYNLKFTVDEEKKKLYVTVGQGGFKDASQVTKVENLVTSLPKPNKLPTRNASGEPQLNIMANQSGEEALRLFLADHGYDLEWEAPNKPTFARQETFNGSIVSILDKAFLPLGYYPKIYKSSEPGVKPTVVIRLTSDVIKEMQEDK